MERSVPHPNCPAPPERTAAIAWTSKNKMKQKRAISPKTWVAPSEPTGLLCCLQSPQWELVPK